MSSCETPKGMRVEGACENERNLANSDLYKDIIREAYGVNDVICGHHIIYTATEKRGGFDYTIVQELPSADAMMFHHDVARKLWGRNFKRILSKLACEPIETRDALLGTLYYSRKRGAKKGK